MESQPSRFYWTTRQFWEDKSGHFVGLSAENTGQNAFNQLAD